MNALSTLRRLGRMLRKQWFPSTRILTKDEYRSLCAATDRSILRLLPEGKWRRDDNIIVDLAGGLERVLLADMNNEGFYLWLFLGMGVNQLEVERVWRESQLWTKRRPHDCAWTVRGRIGYYLPDLEHAHKLFDLEDVEGLVPSLERMIQQACIPFWNRFATIEAIDRDWNSRPFSLERDHTHAFHHAVRSVIVAKLARNPSYHEIIDLRRSELTGRIMNCDELIPLERFERLVQFLG